MECECAVEAYVPRARPEDMRRGCLYGTPNGKAHVLRGHQRVVEVIAAFPGRRQYEKGQERAGVSQCRCDNLFSSIVSDDVDVRF